MADLGNLNFGVHLKDYTDAEADKIKKKLENLSISLKIDGSNVNVSRTDLIKKQVEDALKSVSVQSVKIDGSNVKTQVENAVRSSSPQISVTVLKQSLANDLQGFLNNQVFSIGVTVTRGSAQNAINAAFANISVPVNVTVSSSAVLQQIRQTLSNAKIKIGVEAKNPKDLINDISSKLKGKKLKVDIEADKQALINSVKQSLKGTQIKAHVDVSVDTQAITRAVQSAINNANFTYSPNGRRGNPNSAAQANRNLANSYRQAAGAANQFARASVTLSNGLHTNIRLGGQLGSVLGNFASIFGVKDLLRDVVAIGGQLENQRIALGAILQDGGKATAMFSKIQSLAVKSPFGIMDLNQYVKQLSAYSVPYNELYETMKRLADISAGVGVDMGRIILAFGQVKAAGFLKGTELRQFTEANIPMVDKLAERFTNLTGRIVDAAEVYDMISKKKVTFEDVKSVLWDLTDEGGMFNNMQEVLSESLASKWKNLADAVDVMLGKIADGGIGNILKSVAELLTTITQGWEYVATAIGSATATFLVHKAAVVLGSKQMAAANNLYTSTLANKRIEARNLRVASTYRDLTKAEQQLIKTTNKLTVADTKQLVRANMLNKEEALRLIGLKKLDQTTIAYLQRLYRISDAQVRTAQSTTYLGRALKQLRNAWGALVTSLKGIFLNPTTWIFAAFTAIGEIAMNIARKNAEIKELTKEVEESATGSMQTIGKELDKLRDIKIGELDDTAIKIQIKNLTTLIQNEAPNWQSILANIFKQDADGNFVKTAKQQLEELIQGIKDVQEAKQMLADNSDTFSGIIRDTRGSGDISETFQKYEEAEKKSRKVLDRLANHYNVVSLAIQKVGKDNEQLLSDISGKSVQQQILILEEKYPELIDKVISKLSRVRPIAAETINEYLRFASDEDMWTLFSDDIEQAINNVWSVLISKGYKRGEELDTIAEQFVWDIGNRIVEKAATTDKKVVNDFWNAYLSKFSMEQSDFSVVPADAFPQAGEKYDASKDEVAKLWKKRAEEIDKAVAAYDKWKKIESASKAEQRIKGMDEFANLFNGKYGFSLGLEDPTEAYRYIQSKLNKNLSAQNEVYIALGVKLSDSEFKDAEEKLKLFLDQVKNEVKETSEQWNLYKQLFELTGDKGFAMTAFNKTQVWDDAARNMKDQLEQAMGKLGLDFDADFDIDDSTAKEIYGELYDSWKQIKDRIEKNGIDLKLNTGKAIQSTQSIEEKIKSLENQRDEDLKNYTEGTKEYDRVAQDWENKIIALRGELFELSPAFKDLFVDTTGMASGKLHELWQKANALVTLINQNTTRFVTNANGETIGRYYKDEKGQEKYISEEQYKRLGEQTNKLAKKVPEVKVAFDNLWKAIKGEGKKGYEFKDIAQDIAVLSQEASNTAQSISSMFDSLGNESLADAFALGGNILNGVSQIGSGIASGNPFAVLSGVTGIIGSIAQAHDKKLDRAIQKSQLEVTRLSNAYSQLETIIERQLGGVTAKQSEEMLENLKKQRSELYKQYGLEDEKKKTDKAKLEDYKNQIAELDDQIKYFYEDLASEQYGADISGWAGQIADALTEAFASGEDAAKAFDDTVGGILKELATEAIRLQFIEPAMDQLKNYLFGNSGIFTDNSESGTALSKNEMAGLASELDKLKSQIAASNEYWDYINEATGGLLENTEKSESSMSKAIQGVSENTAELLSSYINDIRANVSVKRALIEKLIVEDIPQMSILAKEQLTQLNNIAANTLRNADAADRIYDLVNRVVDKSGNKLKI